MMSDTQKKLFTRSTLRYSMERLHVGKAVIFNNKTFDDPKLKERKGTDVDANAISNLLENIGFSVIGIYHDQTDVQAIEELDKISANDFKDDNCFVAVFLSHGETGKIFMKKRELSIAGQILSNFRGDKCKSLVGKPKIFIFQACRGIQAEELARIIDARAFIENFQANKITLDDPGWEDLNNEWMENVEVEEGTASSTTPAGVDFLQCYASSEGYLSFRNEKSGSWYIQTFVKVMNDYMEQLEDDETEELDFLSLLTNVANRVGKREIIFPPQKKTNTEVPTDDQIKKQMPSFVSTLTKSLYLPKLTRKRQK